MRARRILAVAGLAASIVVVSAAGASAKSSSPKQWRAQANELCAAMQEERIAGLPASGTAVWSKKDATVAGQYVALAAPLYTQLADDLGALDTPKALKAKARRLVTALEDGVSTITADPMAAFSPFDNPLQGVDDAAQALSLKSCTGLALQKL